MAPASADILREGYEAYARGNNITNPVFKLHYVLSFLLTMLFIASTTVHLYQDSFVECVDPSGESSENVNKYAYYLSTYTTVEKDGLGNSQVIRAVHRYYIWVPVFFIYHMIVFRVTYYIWNKTGGFVLTKLQDVEVRSEPNFMRLLKKYVSDRMKYKLNNEWMAKLMIVEFENILVCLHQWFTADIILEGKFSRLGLDLSSEAADKIFPVRAKFIFNTYGPSGSIQPKDYLCILGLNKLFNMIFIVYWYWLVFLTVMTIANFVYRLCLFKFYQHEWLWVIYSYGCPLKKNYKSWLRSLSYSDWMFFQYLRSTLSLKQNKSLILYLVKKSGVGSDVSSGESDDEQDKNLLGQDYEEESRFQEHLKTLTAPNKIEVDHLQIEPLVDPQKETSDIGEKANIMPFPVLIEKHPQNEVPFDPHTVGTQTSGDGYTGNILAGLDTPEIDPPSNEHLLDTKNSGDEYETSDDTTSEREGVVFNFQNPSAHSHSKC